MGILLDPLQQQVWRCGDRIAWSLCLATSTSPPTIAVEVDNIESGKLLAIQNKGIAFMFLPNVESEVTAGKLAIVPVGPDQINVGTDIILHEDVIGSPVIKKFLTVVEEYFEYKYLE